jgi:hypothetical protein
MEVQFFYNQSDARVINKILLGGENFIGQARDIVDVMNPVVLFDTPDVLRYNYSYIPELQRYYDVTNRTAFREDLWEVSFSVDVLMSFRGDINQLNVVVDKQSMISNGNEYIDDSSLVAENVMFQQVYDFPSGFNSTGEFILITAG